MITKENCDELAEEMLVAYVKHCECVTAEDVANVVMKMAGKCGFLISAYVGQEESVARMNSVVNLIAKPEHATTAKSKKELN